MYMNQGGIKYHQTIINHSLAHNHPLSLKKLNLIKQFSSVVSDFRGRHWNNRMKDYATINSHNTILVKANEKRSRGNKSQPSSTKSSVVMYPSQFQSEKNGKMGFEPKKNLFHQDEGKKKFQLMNDHCLQPKHSRLFSSSKMKDSEELNCSDGMTLPVSFFDPLPQEQKKRFLEIYQNRDLSSTGLLVSVSSIETHFNVDFNLRHKQVHNYLADEFLKSDGSIKPTRHSVVLHVSHIECDKIDDDSVTLPEWAFDLIHTSVGKPVSVSIDMQLIQLQDILLRHFKLTQITLEPLSTNYLEMGMRSDTSKDTDMKRESN